MFRRTRAAGPGLFPVARRDGAMPLRPRGKAATGKGAGIRPGRPRRTRAAGPGHCPRRPGYTSTQLRQAGQSATWAAISA